MGARVLAALLVLLLPVSAFAQAKPKKAKRRAAKGSDVPINPATGKKITLQDLMPRWSDETYRPQASAAASPAFRFTQEELDRLYDNPAPYRPTGFAIVPGDWKPEVEVVNGDLKKAAVTYRPWGLSLEAGHIGLGDSRNNLIGKSPYLNLREKFDCAAQNWIDCRLQFNAGLVYFNGRYFNDPASQDSGAEAFGAGLAELAREGGTAEEDIDKFKALASYNDPYRTNQIFVGSVLGQIGRAYGLFGPVNVGWTLGGMMRLSHFFPNVAGDASVATRVNLPHDRSVTAYGGATHNASPIGNRLFQGFLSPERPEYKYYGETAPHAALEFKGPLPFEDQIKMIVVGYRQWNEYTTLTSVRGALSTDVGGKPTQLVGSWSVEDGARHEYYRTRSYGGVARMFSRSVEGSFGFQKEDFRYGSAQVQNSGLIAGLRINLDGPDPGGVSATQRFDPRDTMVSPHSDFVRASQELNQAVSQILNVAESSQILLRQRPSPYAGDPAHNPERMNDLATSIRNIPPSTRQLYKQTLLAQATDPQERQFIEDLFDGDNLENAALGLDKGARVLRLMSDNTVIERFVIRVARNRMIEFLDRIQVKVPVVDETFRWNPAVFTAAIHALQSRPSPLMPVTAADEKGVIEPWVWRQFARSMRLPDTATPEEITAALIDRGPPALRAELLKSGVRTARAFAEALSSLVRKELNEMLITRILAAEQLDMLTVNGGRKLGELSNTMLSDSFDKRHTRDSWNRVKSLLRGAADRLK